MDCGLDYRPLLWFLVEYVDLIMKRYLLILVAAVLSAQFGIQAQEISNKEKRSLNMKLLNIIEEYERTSKFSDSEEVYSFMDLFKSQDSRVFCDLMGTKSYMTSVSLKDYVKAASSNVRDLDVEIKDVRKGELFWSSGVWTIPVTFRKTMSYVDKNGVLFSAEEFYENEDYNITLNVVYDPADQSCRIESVDGSLRSQKTFPKGDFYVIIKNEDLSERDKDFEASVVADGKPLQYNSFGQTVIPASSKLSVGDPDVLIDTNFIASTDSYRLLNLEFNPIRGRFKARAAIAPIMAFDLDPKTSQSSALETGIDFGTTFVAGNSKFGIYIGAALSQSKVKVTRNYQDKNYGEVLFYNEDKGYYDLVSLDYKDVIISKSLSFRDLTVPLYFEIEHRVNKTFLISWNIGAKAYLPLSTETGDLLIAGTKRIDGQGQTIQVVDGFLNPTTVERSDLSFSVMANIGTDINIVKNRLFATIRAGYEHGLTNVVSTEACPVHSDYRELPLLYHTDSDIVCHSPLSDLTLKRQAVWFELGIKVKM